MEPQKPDIQAIRKLINSGGYRRGDLLVLFGELFTRGYVNGIVEEAKRAGLKIIQSTVGRRDRGGSLRPLTREELAEKTSDLILNVPLEAGFDMTPIPSTGKSPVDQLSDLKMSEWSRAKLEEHQLLEVRDRGRLDFQSRVRSWLEQLSPHITSGKNVLFVHSMAGGVPRAKIIMPALNKVFKGRGDRFIPSSEFWSSDIGKLCEMNFMEVTAETLRTLVDETQKLRDKLQLKDTEFSYVAYGYHGTEVLVEDSYQWQTYTPYIQGWAKMELEKIASTYFQKGIKICVFNCPEILTNSSSIFQGLEVSLYPLLGALKREGADSPGVQSILETCQNKLLQGKSIDDIMDYTADYIRSPEIQSHSVYEKWPQHNSKEQMEKMISSSQEIISWHKDPKDLCNSLLSEEVFQSTGNIMFRAGFQPQHPVQWIGHDIIARQIGQQ